MIQVFEEMGGTGSQMFFLYKDKSLFIKTIPIEIMSSIETKNFLTILIREKCKDPNVEAAAMVAEVNIRNEQDVKVADGLMLTISIPEGDYVILYKVDCKTNKVLGIDHEGFSTENRGRFTGFLKNTNYNKN
jgi:hypothetical protein